MTELFLQTVNMSISASWLVLAVLVLRIFLRKAPRKICILLWAFVALRLSCPFSLESAFSLIPSRQTIPVEIALDHTPELDSGITIIDSAVNPIIAQSNLPKVGASVNPLQVAIFILSVIWIIGIILMLAYTVVSYIRLRLRVRTAILLRDNVYESEHIAFPFVLGIIRPRIYLPTRTDETTCSHVIAHELAHIKRLDHVWKPIGFLLLTLHWFNPFVWLSYILLCRDIEFACDESVIRTLGNDQRADYSEALLSCSINRRSLSACPLAFGESSVKSRVKAVLSYRKPTVWIIAVSLIVCAVVAVCFLTNPSEADENPDESDTHSAQTEPTDTTSPTTDESPTPIPLTKESADATIAEILGTLTVHSDNTVSIEIPESLPISEDGKTELTIAMSATYSDAVGSFSAERLLDNQKGWEGGETPSFKLASDKGKLVNVSLGVFYLTELSKTTSRIYATANTEANAPFTYDIPVGYTAPSAGITQIDDMVSIIYRLTDNSFHTLSLQLPKGVMIQQGNDFTRPLIKDGQTVGSVTLLGFGTTDADTLKELDTSADSLPMQIFAPVALSNHAGYENYTVQTHTESGSVATAKYLWQDLSSGAGVAASIPYQSRHAILAYDYEVMPYFVEIRLDESLCTESELAELAKSLVIE